MQDPLGKLKANRTVVERTKPGPNLPKLALYVEWLAGQNRRKVLDTEKNAYEIDDKVMQSHYKIVPGSKAKELIEKHWPTMGKPVKA